MSFLNWPVLLAVVGAFVVLRRRNVGTFAWTLAILLGLWAWLRFAFAVPIPASVVTIYMGITAVALFTYVTSSRQRREEFVAPLDSLVNEPGRRGLLAIVLLALPALAAGNVYLAHQVTLEAPAFGRTVHPAPPDSITVHEKTIDLAKGKNPLRALETSDPAAFKVHVEKGKVVYYKNCFYCHGDALAGDGMFAHGLNPIPTNFTDKGTIGMLQESFLFWRIAKGGPGLPAEGGPWDSAMPAWEKFLSEEEMWQVVLFLYEHTEQRPRAEGVH